MFNILLKKREYILQRNTTGKEVFLAYEDRSNGTVLQMLQSFEGNRSSPLIMSLHLKGFVPMDF
jgi:hypothetical protein